MRNQLRGVRLRYSDGMKRNTARLVAGMFGILLAVSAVPADLRSEPAEKKPDTATEKDKAPLKFPELVTGPCKRDADCDHSYTYVMDNGRCCNGTCSPKGLPLSTIENILAYCKKAGWEHKHCPTKKCVMPPPVRCIEGSCQLVKSARR